MKYKVIGFDSWTGGALNFERLIAPFREYGIEFSVSHIGSWGSDPGHPEREQVGKVPYRNIDSYAKENLEGILDEEAPDAVLFLSVDTFAHRAFNRLCLQRGIPTLHLYHGLVSVQETGPTRAYKLNPMAQLKFVLVRIPKALRHIWPAYASSMFATGAELRDWLQFAKDIFAYGVLGRRSHVAARDARTSMCCVYVQADSIHAMNRYGFSAEEVIPVGNPDLQRFGLTADLIGCALTLERGDFKDVMYIDTGLVYTGYVFESPGHFVRHLAETAAALGRQGKRLLFKPHPDHLRANILPEIEAAGVVICSNQEMIPRLKECCACIVEPSSLSVVPALLGLPVFRAAYGDLRGQPYGDVLKTYPRSRELSDLASFSDTLIEVEARDDRDAARQWMDRITGPMPSEEMPARVAAILERLVQARRGSVSPR